MIFYISNRQNIPKNADVVWITEEEAYDNLKGIPLLYEDTETKGLNPRMKEPLKLLQLGDGKDEYIFDTPSVPLPNIRRILEDPKVIKVLVNIYFERNMLKSIGIDLRGGFDLSLAYASYRMGRMLRFVDTLHGRSFIYSFAGMYKELLDVDIDKEQQSSFLRESEFYSMEQLEYAARDVRIKDLYEKILSLCIKRGILHKDFNLYETAEIQLNKGIFKMLTLEMMSANVFADMMYNGMLINEAAWMQIYTDNKSNLVKIKRELNKELKENYDDYSYITVEPMQALESKQYNIFGELETTVKKKVDKRRINWNSPIQVKKVLKAVLGYVPLDKKGKETTSIKELEKISRKSHNEVLERIIKKSKTSKLISSFGREYLVENTDSYTGRIRPDINQILETGRVAWRKPNLAQIPGSKAYRSCFISAIGYDLVACDYSAQESRVMAYLAKDSEFIDFFENGGGDSHSMVASKVYSKKFKVDIIVSKDTLEISTASGLEEIPKIVSDMFPKAEVIGKRGEYLIYGTLTGDSNPARQKGKILNFFISFGGSAYTLSSDQGISMAEASSLINGYWEAFKELKIFFNKEIELALKNGYIVAETVTHTVRNLPQHRDMTIAKNKLDKEKKELIEKFGKAQGNKIYWNQIKNKGSELYTYNRRVAIIKGDIERAAMNTRIQTTASRMTKLGSILIEEKIRERRIGNEIRPVLSVHDELLFETLEGTKHENLIQWGMERASILLVGKVIPAKPEKGKVWIH